jgi:hypothetical protein
MISPTKNNRTGMAMMLVMIAVALAAVLGYAVLANVGTQAQISENAAAIAQADCLAESGFNYGMYQLENNAPSAFWSSGTLSLGSTIPGTYSVTITPGTQYKIVSTSSVSVGTVNPTTINRSVTAYVQLNTPAVPNKEAAVFNGPVTWGLLDNIVDGVLAITSGSTITNNTSNVLPILPSDSSSPAPSSVTDFSVPYVYGGVTYSPTLLSTDPAAGTVLGPTASNPLGIYYVNNRIIDLKGVTINGSLIIKSGGVEVNAGSTNIINPVEGYPGLVVNKSTSNVAGAGYLEMSGNKAVLTVNGLVWAQLGVTKLGLTNTGSQLTVNGSLLIPSASPLNSYAGALTLNYSAANVNVPNFSSQSSTIPKNLRVVSWSQ